MPHSLPDFLDLYKNGFLPAYSEIVSYLGEKPAQVLVEIENLSTHLVRYIDESQPEDIRQQNLDKSYNHLVRLVIDCHKILWAVVRDDVLQCVEIASAAAQDGVTREELFHQRLEFKRLSKVAREQEMALVGTKPKECLPAWATAIEFGWDMIGKYKMAMIKPATPTGEEVPEDYKAPFAKEPPTIDEAIEEIAPCAANDA